MKKAKEGKKEKLAAASASPQRLPEPARNPATANESSSSSSSSPTLPGSFLARIDLLVLIAVVFVVNLPFLTGHCMLDHDARFTLGIFDYFYSNLRFDGELPRWMVYGVYGLDANVSHLTFMSAISYLTMYVGSLLSVSDSLMLFSLSVCLEQLLLLLGLYLVGRLLFRERWITFCICLFAACTVVWNAQIAVNFRLCYLLPLEFYCLLRLKRDQKGYFGWLAGIVAILGPLGSAAYFYPFWGVIVSSFALPLFWGKWRILLQMFKPSLGTLLAAAGFLFLAGTFAESASRATENVAFLSPDRQSGTGAVTISTFLTYGGNSLTDVGRSLLLPSAEIAETDGRMGINDYLGVICLIGLSFAFKQSKRPEVRAFFISGAVVFALCRGGLLASLIYFFPGMHLFRHVGLITPVIKVILLILSGFGLETILEKLRLPTPLARPSLAWTFAVIVAAFFYIDLYVGGPVWASVFGYQSPANNGMAVHLASPWFSILRGLMLGTAGLAFLYWLRSSPSQLPILIPILLTACVAGDSLLFQMEYRSLLRLQAQTIPFPAVKPAFATQRADRMAPEMIEKYQAWQLGQGANYQIGMSSALQWDPIEPRLRADSFPQNVLDLWRTLQRVDTNQVQVVCADKLRLVPTAIWAASEVESQNALSSPNDWRNKVVLSPAPSAPAGTSTANSSAGSTTVSQFSANSLKVTVQNDTAAPQWLVYADAYTKGWGATIDNRSVPLLEAYGAFKAVQVPTGRSEVEFRYHDGLRSTCLGLFALSGAILAAAGLLSLAGLTLLQLVGKRVPFLSPA